PTSTKYSLWKAHQNLSAPIATTTPIRNSSGRWARSDKDRAETFATHLQSVFQPNPASNSFVLPLIQPEATRLPTTPTFRPNEIEKVIRGLKSKKAPGGDQLTPKMLIELPKCAIDVVCKLFNGIINLGYFPKKWKKSIIIMIPKPGKDHTIPTSVLGPLLYTLYTADLPVIKDPNLLVATYAADTAFLVNSGSRTIASELMQTQLDALGTWLKRWNIAVNPEKSTLSTFSLRKG
ncbi:hypothetical protein KR018_000782, partial [Drosophila ironensis]